MRSKTRSEKLVLHDFGAGQIRLAELAALGPDVVKFDGALIQGIDKADEKRIKLVTAMVKMVTQLDITPMAEYVETEGEHDKLKELGFELVQGFFYGHPTDIESLVEGVENGDEVESVEVADSAEVMAEANRGPQERPVDALKNLDESADETTSSESPEATSPEAAATPSSATPSYNDDQWLMDKDSESYTIQLMFTATKDAAETFLSERSVPGEYSIYRKWSSNREWFVVVFGTFNDRFEAQSAIEQFGDTGHSSWVRKMESVKEEIKSIDDN